MPKVLREEGVIVREKPLSSGMVRYPWVQEERLPNPRSQFQVLRELCRHWDPEPRESTSPKFAPEFVHTRTPAAVPAHETRTVHKEQAFSGPPPAGNDGSRSLVPGPFSRRANQNLNSSRSCSLYREMARKSEIREAIRPTPGRKFPTSWSGLDMAQAGDTTPVALISSSGWKPYP